MINKIDSFEIIREHLVELEFQDGFRQKVDLKKFLDKGFGNELVNKISFSELFIDDNGALAWPNGFNISPDFLRNMGDEKTVAGNFQVK